MALEPPGPHRVPIHFQGQVVPGVEGEVVFVNNLYWSLTMNHILHLHRNIREELENLTGINLHLGQRDARPVTGQNYGQGFIEYEIFDVPLFHIPQMNNENFGWNGEVGGPEVPNIPVNPYAGIAVGAAEVVPANAEDPILMRPFAPGEVMANFHGEADLENPRYYSKETFNRIELEGVPRRKRNPVTRQVIEPGNVRFYTKAGGARRQSKKSMRKITRRRKTTRRKAKDFCL